MSYKFYLSKNILEEKQSEKVFAVDSSSKQEKKLIQKKIQELSIEIEKNHIDPNSNFKEKIDIKNYKKNEEE